MTGTSAVVTQTNSLLAKRYLGIFRLYIPAQRYASTGLCDINVYVRPSVCPSRAGIVSILVF